MTPTSLGNMPSNVMAPVAKSQINLGTEYGALYIDNQTPSGPTPDGASNGYRITRTLLRPAFLVAEFQTLVQGNRAAWDWAQWILRISPADLDGITDGNFMMMPLNNATQPRSFQCMYAFRCGAGTYTVTADWNGNQGPAGAATIYWINKGYSHLSVDVVGDGVT